MPAVGNGHGASKPSTSLDLRGNARNYRGCSRVGGRWADRGDGKAASHLQ